jgi:glycosyltransferase involved in cell wall biosynthesis
VAAWNVDPGKIEVLPNGVDADFFQPDTGREEARHQLGLNGGPVVGFVGGFQVWHGLDGLVETFAQVIQAEPQARLLLVGDGPARSAIERKVAEVGLETAVTITGFVPQAQVPKMLAATDITVLPYPQLPGELWFSPLKLFEYMAAGKAIVASNSGQIAEILEDGTSGLLVPPGDVAGFSRAIVGLIKDPAQRARLGCRARQQVVERHSWKQYIERLAQIYTGLLPLR